MRYSPSSFRFETAFPEMDQAHLFPSGFERVYSSFCSPSTQTTHRSLKTCAVASSSPLSFSFSRILIYSGRFSSLSPTQVLVPLITGLFSPSYPVLMISEVYSHSLSSTGIWNGVPHAET